MGEFLNLTTGYINQIDESCSALIGEYKDCSIEVYGALKNGFSIILAYFFIFLTALSNKL